MNDDCRMMSDDYRYSSVYSLKRSLFSAEIHNGLFHGVDQWRADRVGRAESTW